MVVWLEGLLNSVALWIKYIIMMVCSFFATLLPMPVPIADISFIANLQAFNSLYWHSIIIMTITITDTAFAVITYKLSDRLTRVLVRSDKRKKQLESLKCKISNNKLADVWVFLACATPIPYTLTIYASSILKYDLTKFIIINVFGRLLKYVIIAVAFYFGIKLIN